MSRKIDDIIKEERKKFVLELVLNSIISNDKDKSSELENRLTRLFVEVERIIQNNDSGSLSYVYDTIINNFFVKINLIVKNTPGLSIGVRDVVSNGELYIYYGKVSSDIDSLKIDADTRFDLASVSKLFTAISLLKKQEEGKINLQKSIHSYDYRFVNLAGVSLEDAAKFYYQINTDGRLDVVDTREQLLSNLYGSYVALENTFVYSDIPYIILGEILKKTDDLGLSYFQEELGMVHTSYDVLGKIITGGNYGNLNLIHDPKAQKMKEFFLDSPGHAGIYSTSEDLVKLGEYIMPNHSFLSKESYDTLVTPARGEYQYEKNGVLVNKNRAMGVYIQTPIGITQSDIAIQASRDTFASSGTTGSYVLIDPKNNFTFNYLCNPYSKEGGCVPICVNGTEKRWSGVTNIIKEELVNLVYELRFAGNIYKKLAFYLAQDNLALEEEDVFETKRIVKK